MHTNIFERWLHHGVKTVTNTSMFHCYQRQSHNVWISGVQFACGQSRLQWLCNAWCRLRRFEDDYTYNTDTKYIYEPKWMCYVNSTLLHAMGTKQHTETITLKLPFLKGTHLRYFPCSQCSVLCITAKVHAPFMPNSVLHFHFLCRNNSL